MPEAQASAPQDVVGKWLGRVCRWFAVIGGAVLVAMTLMSVASIVGRSLFGKPVPGDFELIQIGCAICVAAFLPWCQMQGGNIIVDFFTVRVGAITVKASGETSMIMGFPSWIGYAFMVPGFALTAVVGLYSAYVAWRGKDA